MEEMEEPLSAVEVANNYIIHCNYSRTVFELEKLTYIAHGYMLAIHDMPLVNDPVIASISGPIYHSIRKEFGRWRYDPVGRLGQDRDLRKTTFELKQAKVFLDTFAYYGRFDGFFLIDITKRNSYEKTPWEQCYGGTDTIIPDKITQAYYKKLYDKRGFEY